ncbi:MAG: hypothetical protein ACXWDC_02940 [Aeromicrobium sp.]
MATAGIIVGGSGGLGLGIALGVDIALEPGIAGLSHLPVMILGAAIAASTFAFSAYARCGPSCRSRRSAASRQPSISS